MRKRIDFKLRQSGESPAMTILEEKIKRIAPSQSTVLIQVEKVELEKN